MAFRSFFLAVAFLLVTGVASAADPEAARIFTEGRALLAEGKTQDALVKFKESIKIEPTVGALLNAGECHAKLNERVQAYQRFREAEALAKDQADKLDRATLAKQRAEDLRKEIAIADIILASEGQGTVRIDEGDAIPFNRHLEVPLEAGKHHFVVTSGENRFEGTQELKAGTNASINVVWSAAAPPVTPEPLPKQTSSWLLPGTVLGAGAVITIVGGVFGVMTLGKRGDLDGLCPSYPTCPESRRADASKLDDDGRTFGTVSTIGLIGGVSLLAVGAILALTKR